MIKRVYSAFFYDKPSPMNFKAARNEQIITEQNSWVNKLTRAWLGLFVFTVFINLLPFLPSWDSGEQQEALYVSQVSHTAICSSQTWNSNPPSSTDTDILTTASSGVSVGSTSSDAPCTSTVIAPITVASIDSLFWFLADHGVSLTAFLSSHSARGPPRV